MKCPKCGYTSFDYLRECKKCGEILDDSRKALNLKMSEPLLFVGTDDKTETAASETAKTENIIESPPSPETSFSSTPPIDQLELRTPPLPSKPNAVDLSEDGASGLGSLGSMGRRETPESNINSEDLSGIELELSDTNSVIGLETTPSFSSAPPTSATLKDEDGKEAEFILFEDDDKPVLDNQLENDIPFEFSADDLESDVNLNLPSSNSSDETIDLELDMDDEESLDQILANFETDGSSTK
ncbi:MAG: hypothetical protein J7M09_00645 [Deltaproteobacteria bacterium]|nr:hypothetical protein [Candidatus Tharpella sp.]